jgi:hypothetical protein
VRYGGVTTFALLFAAAQAASMAPTEASAPINPRAVELFESDWVLMNWALKYYDQDRDILLSVAEAQAAAVEFRKIADGDGDGRVTPQEFGEARRFILARY